MKQKGKDISVTEPQCFEEFTESEGNFSTPNYPVKYFKDHTCTWIIHVLPGEQLASHDCCLSAVTWSCESRDGSGEHEALGHLGLDGLNKKGSTPTALVLG